MPHYNKTRLLLLGQKPGYLAVLREWLVACLCQIVGFMGLFLTLDLLQDFGSWADFNFLSGGAAVLVASLAVTTIVNFTRLLIVFVRDNTHPVVKAGPHVD